MKTEIFLSTEDVEKWDVVNLPRRRWFNVDLKAVWKYRELAWMFFKRDFITVYKQTVLGPLWYLIQPLVTTVTFYVVFGKIANLSTNGVPPFLFYMAGIVSWSFFAASLTNNAEIFSKNSHLFSKVYFPRLVVPISVVMSGLVGFAIQFLLLIAIIIGDYFFVSARYSLVSAGLLMLPLLVIYIAALGMGVGLISSAVTVRFRDLALVTTFLTQMWMYATPVVYTFQQIPEKYHWFFYLNPMTAPIDSMRHILFNTPAVALSLWAANLAVVLLILVAGLAFFSYAESTAMDTV